MPSILYGKTPKERRKLARFIENLEEHLWNRSAPTEVLKMAKADDEQRTSVSVTWATKLVEEREFCADEEDEENSAREELNLLMGVINSLMHLSGEEFRNLPPSQLINMAEVYKQRAQLQRTFAKRGHFEKELASVRKEIDSLMAELFPPKRRELVRQLAVRD